MPVLDRVDARAKLKPRRDPYWHRLAQGRYIGFRRMARGSDGTWLARFYDGERYVYEPLGDFANLTERERFDAARRAAEDWFTHLERGGNTGSVMVRDACESYLRKLEQENSKAAAADARGRFVRLVYSDALARVDLKKLAPRHIAEWKKRVFGRGNALASFNRNATSLRAALNLAHKRRDVASDHAWVDELARIKGAEGRRDLYLKPGQRQKLHDKASAELQRFVRTMLLLPLRPGDVAKLTVAAFAADHSVLRVPHGKTEMRTIPISREASVHFAECAKDKLPAAWLIARDSGAQWTKEAWRDGIKEAAAAAKLPQDTCAYTLRHSVITDLVTDGLDLFTVAKLSGTSVAMIEAHYGHLQREHARNALEALSMKK